MPVELPYIRGFYFGQFPCLQYLSCLLIKFSCTDFTVTIRLHGWLTVNNNGWLKVNNNGWLTVNNNGWLTVNNNRWLTVNNNGWLTVNNNGWPKVNNNGWLTVNNLPHDSFFLFFCCSFWLNVCMQIKMETQRTDHSEWTAVTVPVPVRIFKVLKLQVYLADFLQNCWKCCICRDQWDPQPLVFRVNWSSITLCFVRWSCDLVTQAEIS